MEKFDLNSLKQLYIPPAGSHKGQNGKLLVIGGSHLFHAASLWALTIASRIVDMVFYSSVPENNQIVAEAKREFRNGIVVPRDDLDRYASEADVIMIGPGMLRVESRKSKVETNSNVQNLNDITHLTQIILRVRAIARIEKFPTSLSLRLNNKTMRNMSDINKIADEGEQSYYLTKYLLEKYPKKKWVIDAGALQMMDLDWLLPLEGRVVLTPHIGEFERIFSKDLKSSVFAKSFGGQAGEAKPADAKAMAGKQNLKIQGETVCEMAKKYNSIILLKGHEDVVCSAEKCIKVAGGNAGMTKGGTGDVLAGLVGAIACNNDLWLSATAASYINKKAGDCLFEKVGYYFNASDLADEIPRVMRELIIEN